MAPVSQELEPPTNPGRFSSGADHRLNRKFGERFGDKTYAFEELVAELGAAYLCAHLEITNTPRPDHAQYLANWVAVLKGDSKAIFTAASLATRAVDYLYGLQPAAEPAPNMQQIVGEETPVRPDGETACRHNGVAARGLRS